MSDKSSQLASLPSVIKQDIEARLKDLHTSMPGIIESFDPVKQTATIQPAIKRIFITREEDVEILTASDLPILINVPIYFPRGGGFSQTMPVKKGDECLINFSERSIDNWHETGKIKVPGARRFHHLSDAIATIGVSSLTNKIPNYDPDNMELKSDNGEVSIKWNSDGSINIKTTANLFIDSDADIVGNCANVNITATSSATLTSPTVLITGNATIDGTLNVTGAMTAPTVAATNSLTVAGKEQKEHNHAPGTYTVGIDPVTGTSGDPV